MVPRTDIASLKASAGPLAEFDVDGEQHVLRCAYPRDAAVRRGDARFFAELRKLSANAFFDISTPNEAEVLSWVEHRYDGDMSQMNFIIADARGHRCGFIGLTDIDLRARRAEFGRVMRSPNAPRGMMLRALNACFSWARDDLGLEHFRLEVFAENERAIPLYECAGFVRTASHRRSFEGSPGNGRWAKSDAPGGREVLEMKLDLGHG